MGVYDKIGDKTIHQIGVWMTTTYKDERDAEGNVIEADKYNPSVHPEIVDKEHIQPAMVNGTSGAPITESGQYSVRYTGLTQDKIYYLWPYYDLGTDANPDRHFGEMYIAMTTADKFPTVYYGLDTLKESWREEEQGVPPDGTTHSFRISAAKEEGADNDKDLNAWGDVRVTPTYYLADEFGNIMYYEEQQTADGVKVDVPVEITNSTEDRTIRVRNGDQKFNPETGEMENVVKEVVLEKDALTKAIGTVALKTENGVVGIDSTTKKAGSIVRVFTDNMTSTTVSVRAVNDDNVLQHHLILRLSLSIAKHSGGFCQLNRGQSSMDIFVRDEDDEITTFKMGVGGSGIYVDEDGKAKISTMTAVNGGDEEEPTQFKYQFEGLQVNYSRTGTLTVNYRNIGEGDLLNIQAGIYKDANGSAYSGINDDVAPFVVEEKDTDNLVKSMDVTGSMEVHPAKGLGDGVHSAWLIIKADNMEVQDYIRIELKQVVGQSTLKGRVYIVPNTENLNNKVGVSHVAVYDTRYITSADTMGKPAYETDTDEYGFYEIRNILNNTQYQIVVTRSGFVEYNSSKAPRTGMVALDLRSHSGSHVYNLDVCLRGGDIAGEKIYKDDGTYTISTTPNAIVDDTDMEMLTDNYAKYWGFHSGTFQWKEADEEAFTEAYTKSMTLNDVVEQHRGSYGQGATFEGLNVTWASGAAVFSNDTEELTAPAYKVYKDGKEMTLADYLKEDETARDGHTYTYKTYQWDVDAELLRILRMCDFNGDGVINSMDRNYLYSNRTFKIYDYASLSPVD